MTRTIAVNPHRLTLDDLAALGRAHGKHVADLAALQLANDPLEPSQHNISIVGLAHHLKSTTHPFEPFDGESADDILDDRMDADIGRNVVDASIHVGIVDRADFHTRKRFPTTYPPR